MAMYSLMKLKTNEHDNTVLGHPLIVLMRSENLNEIDEKIQHLIYDGCPISSLRVYSDIPLKMLLEIEHDM